MPVGTEAADAGWSWTAPQSRARAAAVANAAGRLEDRFIVNLSPFGARSAYGFWVNDD